MPARIQELQGVSIWVVTADGNIAPLNEQLLGAASTQLLWERDNIADPAGVLHKTTPLRFIVVHKFTGSIARSASYDFVNPIQITFKSNQIYNPLGLKTLWDLPIASTDKLAPTPYLKSAHIQGVISTSSAQGPDFPFFIQLFTINLDPNNPASQLPKLIGTTTARAPSNTRSSPFSKTYRFIPPLRADGVRLDIETWNTMLGGTNDVRGMMVLEFIQSLEGD
jgi:hypothetical protein